MWINTHSHVQVLLWEIALAEDNLKSKRRSFKLVWDRDKRTWHTIWNVETSYEFFTAAYPAVTMCVSLVACKSHVLFLIRQLRTLLPVLWWWWWVICQFRIGNTKIQIWSWVRRWGVMYRANNRPRVDPFPHFLPSPNLQKGLDVSPGPLSAFLFSMVKSFQMSKSMSSKCYLLEMS